MHRFSRDFPGARTLRLEQNYRSTGTILNAANALIANNDGRLGKNLWTAGEEGEPIELYCAYNEQDEARFVIERVQHLVDQGTSRAVEMAVLYRSNAQSRVFEERLLQTGIPYRVYGGLRFFERQEIKDALAYLRLCANREDDASFERVVNQPPRGIGERTLEVVRERAKSAGVSLWAAAQAVTGAAALPARAAHALQAFLHGIDTLAESTETLPLDEQVEHTLQHSALRAHYQKEKGEKGQARLENLDELINAAREFGLAERDAHELDPLSAFLSHAALEAGEGQADAWEDCLQLMTLHSAKGLEFDYVFLVGLEEGLFPHQLSAEEPGRLAEERRLCYVGITRARRALLLSYAEHRRLYGNDIYGVPSRFIREIPGELVREIRPRIQVSRTTVTRPAAITNETTGEYHLGQRVRHSKFGEGVILDYEGQGSHARVQVKFENAGAKWLVVAYANLASV